MTEKFSASVQDAIGIKLSDKELSKIFEKYAAKEHEVLDRATFVRDLKTRLSNQVDHRVVQKHLRALEPSHSNYDQILRKIKIRLIDIFHSAKVESIYGRGLQLLNGTKSPTMSRSEFRAICKHRLGVHMSEENAETVFSNLDPSCSGCIRVRGLLKAVLAVPSTDNVDDGANELKKLKVGTFSDNQSATVSYDNRFKGLHPPGPESAQKMTIYELEMLIRDRIFERTHLGSNLIQSLIHSFGDSRHKEQMDGITKDQMCYTLWKTFQIPVSEADIDKLFEKYDPHSTGKIPMLAFVSGIISQHHLNEPLIDDPQVKSEETFIMQGFHRSSIPSFLKFLRAKLNDIVNRESRAPHYLLHGTNRMTVNQARHFLEKRLYVKASPQLLDELLEHYSANKLIDMKRVLRDAMGMTAEQGDVTLNTSALLNGGIVAVNKMPASLHGFSRTPDQLKEELYVKMFERQKNDHPLANLHRVFRAAGQDTRRCDKEGLRAVFHRYDIIVNETDFDTFFSQHDRGDGFVDVRKFLISVMPEEDTVSNAIAPKDPDEYSAQLAMASGLSKITGKMRQVSSLQGPTHTRLHLNQSPTHQDQLSLMNRMENMDSRECESMKNEPTFTPVVPFIQTIVNQGPQEKKSLTAHHLHNVTIDEVRDKTTDTDVLLEMPHPEHSSAIAALGSPEIDLSTRMPGFSPTEMQHPNMATTSFEKVGRKDADEDCDDDDFFGAVLRSPEVVNKEHSPQKPVRPKHSPPSSRKQAPARARTMKEIADLDPEVALHLLAELGVKPPSGQQSSRSGKTPRSVRHVDTGRPRSRKVDPLSSLLKYKYDVAKKNTTTSSESYGLFVKNYSKAVKGHKKLLDYSP